MRFYPHNISANIVGQATSASLAQLTTYLNNFSNISVAVSTASLALNISGSAGTAGANYTKVGDTGPVGDRGPTGPRGNSIYLLSGSWNTGSCTPTACYATVFGTADGSNNCNFGFTSTLYSADVTALVGSTVMYYDSVCTIPATNVSQLAYNGQVVYTDMSAVLQELVICNGGGGF